MRKIKLEEKQLSETSYQQQALVGATGVEMIIALYDGALRFLYRAMQCVEEDDVYGRRLAVKKVIDILMYLQARLRPELGGSVASSLSDFYATMFTMTLEASHLESVEQFQEVIAFVRNVREAWVVVARDPTGSVLGTDSTQSLDQLMEFVRNQDQRAVKKLTREGHLFRIKSGSSVEILGFDSGEHAYKVRVIGSNKEIWLVKETVFNK